MCANASLILVRARAGQGRQTAGESDGFRAGVFVCVFVCVCVCERERARERERDSVTASLILYT